MKAGSEPFEVIQIRDDNVLTRGLVGKRTGRIKETLERNLYIEPCNHLDMESKANNTCVNVSAIL